MGNINRVIISLGSNQDSEDNIECAIMELEAHFNSIHFSEPVYTKPVGNISNQKPFLNQISIGYTQETAVELKTLFKEIEQLFGRNHEDESKGIIALDIDLLVWNDIYFKPEEMQRDYIANGIQELIDQGL